VWKNIKTSNYYGLLVIGVVILLLLAGIGGWRYYESSRAKADYHDVNSGLERIEDRVGRAETGLNATQAEIYNAESELRGAAEAAGSIADKTRKNREILDECNDIINRNEERTARIEVIIRRVEERNKEYGAQADSRT
jgi:chromosome segregation ATPase